MNPYIKFKKIENAMLLLKLSNTDIFAFSWRLLLLLESFPAVLGWLSKSRLRLNNENFSCNAEFESWPVLERLWTTTVGASSLELWFLFSITRNFDSLRFPSSNNYEVSSADFSGSSMEHIKIPGQNFLFQNSVCVQIFDLVCKTTS